MPIDYEAMSADALGEYRNKLKRDYEAKRDESTLIWKQKVTDERNREFENAHSLPPGTIHTVIAPPPAELTVEGQ